MKKTTLITFICVFMVILIVAIIAIIAIVSSGAINSETPKLADTPNISTKAKFAGTDDAEKKDKSASDNFGGSDTKQNDNTTKETETDAVYTVDNYGGGDLQKRY